MQIYFGQLQLRTQDQAHPGSGHREKDAQENQRPLIHFATSARNTLALQVQNP